MDTWRYVSERLQQLRTSPQIATNNRHYTKHTLTYTAKKTKHARTQTRTHICQVVELC